jgi:hypothetical protein
MPYIEPHHLVANTRDLANSPANLYAELAMTSATRVSREQPTATAKRIRTNAAHNILAPNLQLPLSKEFLSQHPGQETSATSANPDTPPVQLIGQRIT